ncbi:hypothetical protein VNI00_016912 [Paramarasmius palmivorus]|uniref:Uncharacterized protein n=1 Tax=Paramarasmius palmivorus TaxID=297713 RepID=A0AAW0BA25_9AGAR
MSWLEKEKCYWSFDPRGRDRIPEATQKSFGLPTFDAKIFAGHLKWSPGHYNHIRGLHLSKGFDPTSTELARSLEYPILEVVDRFNTSNLDISPGDSLKAQGEHCSTQASPTMPTTPSEAAVASDVETLKLPSPGQSSPGLQRGDSAVREDATLSRNPGPTTAVQASEHDSIPATTGQYHLRHRETRSFIVSNDITAVSPEMGLQPSKSRKQKRVDDSDNVPRKKSRRIEHSQKNERKHQRPSEPDSDRPKKRHCGL